MSFGSTETDMDSMPYFNTIRLWFIIMLLKVFFVLLAYSITPQNGGFCQQFCEKT